jgi:hypothetical protein
VKLAIAFLFAGITFLFGCGGSPSATTPKAQSPVQPATTAAAKKVAPAKRGYETPEKAFAAYTKAMQAKEWGTAFDCMTPAMQRMEVLGLYFAAGMNESKVAERHIDEEKFMPQYKALGAEPTEEQVMALVLKFTPDKRAFFIDAANDLAEQLLRSMPQGPLKKVTINDRKARGVAINFMERMESEPGQPMKTLRDEYEEEFYFVQGNDGWLMDAPPGASGLVRDAEPKK